MSTETEPKLKPCPNPWCGNDYDFYIAKLPGDVCVICNDCLFEGPVANTKEEAIRLWNTRPESPLEKARREVAEAAARIMSRDVDRDLSVMLFNIKIMEHADAIRGGMEEDNGE